ncbi:flagellar basal body P-ring protein FlgI [Oleiagrimonas citrea]|uniref:Flagellar P-ring protein n=1 Tax=Oleiagrimonas citrea TaxID=1665687 RepID=A0A846ZN91_9GAMM|nr:flagellar basal body P-ring protein FlgI [Oleiagrimonas citrea]NKZ39018.1 flagellar basal body P-ring protein FlgI [Oleiagrimonas citrea]
MRRCTILLALLLVGAANAALGASGPVRLKAIARIEGARDNALTGYGIVIGLAGSGDSRKNLVTSQSVANALSHYGIKISPQDLSTRNVAAVMVTATLPAFAESGQKIDVEVSSLGDARSLSGGMLLLTSLNGPDGKLYALAQGPVSVGGYLVRSFGSRDQQNHPTVGRVPDGATIERAAPLGLYGDGQSLDVVLYQPDFVTAERVANSINAHVSGVRAEAIHAGKIEVHLDHPRKNVVGLIASIETVPVTPDSVARVVVNERTGTVVSGGDVSIGAVTVSQGDLRIVVQTHYQVSQPDGAYIRPSGAIGTAVVPDTHIHVGQPEAREVSIPGGATVADLISALRAVHLSTRDVITVLQSIKAAGALHGELVIQ